MLKEQAITVATQIAATHNEDIYVVESPLDVRSGNEFEEGAYGFGPGDSLPLLYAHGVVVARINPAGEVFAFEPPKVIDAARFEHVKNSETFESLAG